MPEHPGPPKLQRLRRVAADVDLHALALALDAPALIERGDAPRESWHVIPLAPCAGVEVGETTTRWWIGDRVVEEQAEPIAPCLHALTNFALGNGAPPPEDIPFAGGAVVLLSYGMARELEELPCTTEMRDAIPRLALFQCSAALLVPVGGGAAVFAWIPANPKAPKLGLLPDQAAEWLQRCDEALRDPAAGARGKEPHGRPIGEVRALWEQGDHEAAARELIENERAGEIYQANLTQRFEVEWEGSALPLHRHLRRSNPSPFSGWMRDPRGRWEVVSGSPERLVRRHGSELMTEPIAGTIPLPDGPRTTPEDAARLASRLVASAKDHAEHVMIVDLHRNDLGRVSVPGSVRVEQMMRLDRRSHVIQAIADIRGRAHPIDGPVDIVRAMFPGGCVTGVPKIRAMQLLDSLERWSRGPYTGSFGYISRWGDLDLNVLIRSAWRSGSRLAFAAGGGIVLDSDPAAEHRESLAKAESVRAAIEALRAEHA